MREMPLASSCKINPPFEGGKDDFDNEESITASPGRVSG